MKFVFSLLAIASVCYATSDTNNDLHLFVKGKIYHKGYPISDTYGDGNSQLPFNETKRESLCETFHKALKNNPIIRNSWILCKVEYVNKGEALMHAWLNKSQMRAEKLDYEESCFPSSLRHYFEWFAFYRRVMTDKKYYLGKVMDLYSSEKYTHKTPQKRLKLKTMSITGKLFKEGKPVEFNVPHYEMLNESLCENVYKAISSNEKLAPAWSKCQVRVAHKRVATLSVSFCKYYLKKGQVDYSTVKFAELLKSLLNNFVYSPTPTGYYFEKVDKVDGAMNIWVEGITYRQGRPYPFTHLDGKPYTPAYDFYTDNLCTNNYMAFKTNELIQEAWEDCVVRLVKGDQALSDIWLNETSLTKAGITYDAKCFPTYFKYYLERYGAVKSILVDPKLYYYGKINLIYGHRKNDGI